MTEKIKDLIYDCSDILLGLLIIGCMIFVISWKVTDAMDINLAFNDTEASIETTNELPVSENTTELGGNTEEIIVLEPVVENPIDEPIKNDATASEDIPNETTVDKPIETNPPREITIEIPKGTIGSGIAKILKEEGMIDNTSDFISRVEELKLAPKLRFGTFKFRSNNTLDEIIHILTGTK